MNSAHIPSILVNGFLSSGKTTYIQDCFKTTIFTRKGARFFSLLRKVRWIMTWNS